MDHPSRNMEGSGAEVISLWGPDLRGFRGEDLKELPWSWGLITEIKLKLRQKYMF